MYGTVSPDHADIEIAVDGQVQRVLAGGSGGALAELHPQVLELILSATIYVLTLIYN